MTSTTGFGPSGIQPLKFKVLVEPKEVERQTKGGLYMPDEVVERESFARTEGILVDVAPDAFTFESGVHWGKKPDIGDRVMFSKYNAVETHGADGRKYWIMNDDAIVAIVEPRDET